MTQTQKASLEAIEECKKMTALMTTAINTRAAQQKDYDDRMVEYQRRKGLYDASRTEYSAKCSGSCANGGVHQFGCHPMCTNWLKLNPDPIKPTDPVFPDLGTFVCTICNQTVDLAATASRDVNVAKGAITQQMSCISSLEKAIAEGTGASGTVPPASGGTSGGTTAPPATGGASGGTTAPPATGGASGGTTAPPATGGGTSGGTTAPPATSGGDTSIPPASGSGNPATPAPTSTPSADDEEKSTGFIASIAEKLGLSEAAVLYGGAGIIILIIVIIFALLIRAARGSSRAGGAPLFEDADWELREVL